MRKDLETNINEKLNADGASSGLVSAFLHQVRRVSNGETGLIYGQDIQAVTDLPDSESFKNYSNQALANLDKVALIKLNGGLGTSMGLNKAKSLLPAKDGKSFLEIIVSQLSHFEKNYAKNIPLILMNSFRTESDCLEHLKSLEDFDLDQGGVPVSFLQNRVPKLHADSLEPISLSNRDSEEWCPPGHGDIYTALYQSGILNNLIDRGLEYAFVSNADNLGATLDLEIYGHFIESQSSFLMEVADRTEADKKGGHLSKSRSSGRLLLREVAQCPPEEITSFQDVQLFKYFNTNSIWLNLKALKTKLKGNEGYLDLPLIVNRKSIDTTEGSVQVIQLETAMGSAIGEFEEASAIRVPRSRFLPVKRTNDLLRLWSDRYSLDSSSRVISNKCFTENVRIDLDDKFFSKIKDFQTRFSNGAPSLRECKSFQVKGDVSFGKGIVCQGDAKVENNNTQQLKIPDESILTS